MQVPVLKDYQVVNKNRVVQLFLSGLQKLLLVMPTGTGKTTVFSSLTSDWVREGKKVLIIIHRIELLDQIVERLSQFGIKAGLIMGGEEVDLGLRAQVAMVQSIPQDLLWTPDFIIIDECHHSTADSYSRLWTMYPKSKILGVTASPIRLDGKTFSGLYQEMIDIYPLRWYIENGHLLRPKHYVCSEPVEQIRVGLVNGDYDLTAMSREMRKEKRIADVIRSYQLFTPNRRAVVFACDILHSLALVRRFNECGIPAAHLDGTIDKKKRVEIISDFRKGKVRVLCNYDIVSEGFDVPAIEATIFARMSKSLAFFIQAIGRCLRPDQVNGKEFGYVLDCSNMWLEHGIAGTNYKWSLTESVNRDAILGSKLYNVDEKGKLFSYVEPIEDSGIELCQLSEEMGRLVMFDKYLNETTIEDHKPSEAVRRYDDFLKFQGFHMTKFEKRYCEGMLIKLGEHVTPGFWDEFLEVA